MRAISYLKGYEVIETFGIHVVPGDIISVLGYMLKVKTNKPKLKFHDWGDTVGAESIISVLLGTPVNSEFEPSGTSPVIMVEVSNDKAIIALHPLKDDSVDTTQPF